MREEDAKIAGWWLRKIDNISLMTYNRSVVDNLIPTKIEETLPKFSKK